MFARPPGAQQFDQYGKIFTVKLQYVFYKERPGVRPGQVTKAERITNKLSQFAAYAIQGDYQGCKEFASDLKKLGMPVEHAPQVCDSLRGRQPRGMAVHGLHTPQGPTAGN